jgi:hypothetical protein
MAFIALRSEQAERGESLSTFSVRKFGHNAEFSLHMSDTLAKISTPRKEMSASSSPQLRMSYQSTPSSQSDWLCMTGLSFDTSGIC